MMINTSTIVHFAMGSIRNIGIVFLLGYTFSLPTSAANAQTTTSLPIVGWLEQTKVISFDIGILTAKLDTGADNSSLHATNIEIIEQNNQAWVKFDTVNKTHLKLPLKRMTEIKMKNGKLQSRSVVELNICLGHILQTIEVNLINRAHFKHPLLLGRSALRPFLISPKNTYLLGEPKCH